MKRGPKSRTCYICGRQYMIHSFPIHEAQCRELFEKREAQKPPNQRRKVPEDPLRMFNSGKSYDPNMTEQQLDELNTQAFHAWNEQALVKCENCGRSFLPEKLAVHQRSCTSQNPAKPVQRPTDRSGNSAKLNGLGYDLGNLSISDADINSGNLMNCPNCGRHFAGPSYAKHVKVCAKVFSKKRKVYDSAKHRAMGTDLEQYQQQPQRSTKSAGKISAKTPSQGSKKGSIPKWKLDSLRFRQAMREAKMVSHAEVQSKLTGIPLQQLLPAQRNSLKSDMGLLDGKQEYNLDDYDDGMVRCPHCGRKFSQKAGARHIPQCKNIINKPTTVHAHSGILSYSTNSPDNKSRSSSSGNVDGLSSTNLRTGVSFSKSSSGRRSFDGSGSRFSSSESGLGRSMNSRNSISNQGASSGGIVNSNVTSRDNPLANYF